MNEFLFSINYHHNNKMIDLGGELRFIVSLKMFRLWSQNINGIDCTNHMQSLANAIHELSHYEMHFFGFSEINVNTNNAYIRDTIEDVVQHTLPASRVSMSSTKTDNYSERRQYGGTLSFASGSLAARVAACGKDVYGRFSWMQFFGKKFHLRIYNVYNPVPHFDSSTHDSTVWVQQRTMLLADGINDNPKRHLLCILMTMIEGDIQNNRQVIVIGDMNCNIFDEKLNASL